MNYIKPLIAILVLSFARCGYEDIPNPRTGKTERQYQREKDQRNARKRIEFCTITVLVCQSMTPPGGTAPGGCNFTLSYVCTGYTNTI
ncbi:MAG TPA: hypothetical protein PKA91_11205 [Leptospiraceae bacterium]|nr:hypothetical protein [Leptospiraceae bacterium]